MSDYTIPTELPPILKDLSREVLRHQPTDIVQFCADYFSKLLSEQRTVLMEHADANTKTAFTATGSRPSSSAPNANPTGPANEYAYTTDDGFGTEDDDDDDEDETEDDAPIPAPVLNRGRRTSVSAESMAPTSHDQQIEKLVIPKTDEQKARIQKSVGNNFLFRNLDEDQYLDVVNAMAEKRVPNGEVVIRQGGVGDYFYVVETGTLDVYVNRNNSGDIKVFDYGAGGSFGELALMYNAPRAATIKATSDCVLWALDRVTFRRILMDHTSRKRRMYEGFLEEVPLLSSLEQYERHKIADALERSPSTMARGEADVVKVDEHGVEHHFRPLKKGSYFGELALLSDKPRVATIRAKGRLKCATLGKKAFTRLLGPLTDIMQRNTQNYEKYPGEG
ncbi:camp-dependent protein kinase regulatory subunit [Catenaria anguillulae PL171]|uniref:cAMP-dependent protein kinase regulatory subunit n=1 Tax=Catenaria anguillulae PL171 TaxID=765915 RepID=A0A1Y2I493_9FUNG|nr:camp-dependent protein kinase regulatory subunit [Catenaria anguillulae PL171]